MAISTQSQELSKQFLKYWCQNDGESPCSYTGSVLCRSHEQFCVPKAKKKTF